MLKNSLTLYRKFTEGFYWRVESWINCRVSLRTMTLAVKLMAEHRHVDMEMIYTEKTPEE